MKKNVFAILLVGIALVFVECGNNTYNDLRKKEDKLIKNYISRNELVILEDEPAADHVWGEKEFYKVKGYDDLYFHLIRRGDSVRYDTISESKEDTIDLQILEGDIIVARYKKFELTENADTISYWTTLDQANPVQFHYMNTSECDIIGWHLAILLMKYPDSQCEVLVPSKLGSSNDQSTVTPYMYVLKIKVKQ